MFLPKLAPRTARAFGPELLAGIGRIRFGEDDFPRTKKVDEVAGEWPDADAVAGECWRDDLAPAGDRSAADLIRAERPEERVCGWASGHDFACAVEIAIRLEPQAQSKVAA